MAPLPVGEGLGVGASEDARPSGLAPPIPDPSPTGKGEMSQAHRSLVLDRDAKTWEPVFRITFTKSGSAAGLSGSGSAAHSMATAALTTPIYLAFTEFCDT